MLTCLLRDQPLNYHWLFNRKLDQHSTSWHSAVTKTLSIQARREELLSSQRNLVTGHYSGLSANFMQNKLIRHLTQHLNGQHRIILSCQVQLLNNWKSYSCCFWWHRNYFNRIMKKIRHEIELLRIYLQYSCQFQLYIGFGRNTNR